MATNTNTARAFEPGETNARAKRPTEVAQTPQRDAKGAADTTAAAEPQAPAPPAAPKAGTGVTMPATPQRVTPPKKAAKAAKTKRR